MLKEKELRDGNLAGSMIAGILIFAFPALALAEQSHRLNTGTPLMLDVEAVSLATDGLISKIKFATPLNRLSTSQLSGENDFLPSENIHVFMSPGPNSIWYPYAISKRAPDKVCDTDECLILKGRVDQIIRGSMSIDYNFNALPFRSEMQAVLADGSDTRLVVQVDELGNSTLKTIRMAGKTIDQNIRLDWAPPGMRSLGAKNAPAMNPPK